MGWDLPVLYHSLDWTERRQVREQYAKEQNGLCMYCGNPLDGDCREDIKSKPIRRSLFPESFFNYPVHLQHCHKTGMTEGAVHNYCNAVMWQYDGR